MYGDEAIKLLRELKRFKDSLPTHNTDLVRSIQREIRHLFTEVQQYLTERTDPETGEAQTIHTSDRAFVAVASSAIARNKRCLLAYHHHRMYHIAQIVWDNRAEGAGLLQPPAHVRPKLCPAEQVFYKRYAALVHQYKSHFDDIIDITGSLVPPRTCFVHVRAVKDLRVMTDSGEEKVLLQGQMDFVLRNDVERYIEQGYLIQV